MTALPTVRVDDVDWDYEVDVLVAGAGNGGLSAAIAAAEAGARTMLIEMASVTGGSSAMSGGVISPAFAQSHDDLVQLTHGMWEEAFSRAYWTGWEKYRDWLQEIGAAVRPTPIGDFIPVEGSLSMGTDPSRPSQPQARDYFTSLEGIFAKLDGTLKLKTRALGLLTDENGTIVGLRARSWVASPLETDGPIINIAARNVVLAIGGFNQSKELRARYIGPDADLTAPVGIPYNRGDGIAIGQAVGASLSGSMSNVYGALMSAFPARRPWENPVEWEARTEQEKSDLFDLLGFMFPPGWVAVNLDGKRFVDESLVYYRQCQEVAKQYRATGIMIFDQEMYNAVADIRITEPGTGASEQDKFDKRAALEGVSLIKADTLDELVDELSKPGPHETYRANLVKTLEEVNNAADTGDGDLEVHRSQLGKLENGPFYAWPYTSGVVFTMGGLEINTDSEVLDSQRAPVPGLYAAPPCAGGVFSRHYGGSIATAGVFGWIAGRNAAARTTAEQTTSQRSSVGVR